VRDLLAEEPVIALHGPRTVGKSTLLRSLAASRGKEVIDLDEPQTRDAVEASPSAFAGGESPVFIDEYQHAPSILDAIKAELNRDLRPGRFVLTGSTRYASLPKAAQSLTGRLHTVTLWPLSQGEQTGVREDFAERLLDSPANLVTQAMSKTSRGEYVERVLRGGFPLALARPTPQSRARWFDDYLALVLERDVAELSNIRQREKMPRLVARLGGQTAQVLNVARAAADIGLEASVAEHYVRLLESVFLVHRLPAWGTSLRARASSKPKLHFVDSGLAGRMLRVTADKLSTAQPAAFTELGRLLETFCVGEILKQVGWLPEPVHAGHWRTHDGDEVDLVLERDDGAVVGIEVKTGERVPGDQFRSLRKLRDSLGAGFLGGVVLHMGSRSYTYDDRLHAVPIDRLWLPS
jgi:predicted AAA+ superfamily ATPase